MGCFGDKTEPKKVINYQSYGSLSIIRVASWSYYVQESSWLRFEYNHVVSTRLYIWQACKQCCSTLCGITEHYSTVNAITQQWEQLLLRDGISPIFWTSPWSNTVERFRSIYKLIISLSLSLHFKVFWCITRVCRPHNGDSHFKSRLWTPWKSHRDR